ncbi:hypothetical protein BD410DRAFT_355588 [Rickenella mellea]|uniref:Uncharacterized protein n=1 Tax=Rickenella mellea TaxID=50990 RepID=A0A4Y7Q0D8_9AGAM|nr:hypothetical protein BD410DRAFT_355588 [Rickenella mellea]
MAKDVISDKVVYERNEKMFEEFLRRMRSDDEAYFLDWVPKFKQWLGNPKAYYKAARPKIVEILETAGDTITRLNNSLPFETQDGINPSIESRRMAFITLVQADSFTPALTDDLPEKGCQFQVQPSKILRERRA